MDEILDIAAFTAPDEAPSAAPDVAHFRQIMLWPVHLARTATSDRSRDHAEEFAKLAVGHPWREVQDEFTGNPADFHDRHYNEFVTFLPPVQRFLYGQNFGKRTNGTCGRNPVKVMRRCDVAAMRVILSPGAAPLVLKVAHIDLYFFFDIDVAILALEFFADDLPFTLAQDIMFRLGRAYPAYWEKDGTPGHCPLLLELLSKTGEVLCTSDFADRPKYLAHVCQHRAARIGAHWKFLLQPMMPHDSAQDGALCYRQLEYYRMPLMAFLSLRDTQSLTRADYVRLALANGSGDRVRLPFNERHLADFEGKYCYDRFHEKREDDDWAGTRFMSCGHAFVTTGNAANPFFVDGERGLLNAFRHQHFLLFLIAHFHKATLLMFSDRLAEAVNRLDPNDPAAVRQFRRATKQALETFLRFTHRYWFHVVSNQDRARDLFALCRRHLGLDERYEHIRQEVQEMSQYLENEVARRQNESVVRLTVVTAFGLMGTVATGFLGMNLFDHTTESTATKLIIFALVFVPTLVLTFYTIIKSQRLFEFIDTLASENADMKDKWRAFMGIWRSGQSGP
jgi:CorA-like Mg2+ transporter protein